MSKGKSKTGNRSGSDSNNASRASASDRQHARQRTMEGKSLKAGTDSGGKLKEGEGGSKRETRR
jgi:hypothetical protein